MKFGALENERKSTLNRSHFAATSTQNSEIIQINDPRIIDDVRTFACRGDNVSPFLIEPYKSVVRLESTYDPINFSISQHTTCTTLSRDEGVTCAIPKKALTCSIEHVKRKNSFAETWKKCTEKVFKTEPSLDSGKESIESEASCTSLKNNHSQQKLVIINDILKQQPKKAS